eukprot:gnl/TRDRNA2_/TRDRNA2_141759_c0_seq2.p1 gnl/TRDRNA2_/TRDRNA2_141759_c0~~gnl/TRDRNA2_/TRDRNA2_141759_c0_seq2.p1  ORF type:complete len:143 (+),score=0.70 gnl/TRDRNA2_/TRDRNA2_141759_c0_seq2:191-619(+)
MTAKLRWKTWVLWAYKFASHPLPFRGVDHLVVQISLQSHGHRRTLTQCHTGIDHFKEIQTRFHHPLDLARKHPFARAFWLIHSGEEPRNELLIHFLICYPLFRAPNFVQHSNNCIDVNIDSDAVTQMHLRLIYLEEVGLRLK